MLGNEVEQGFPLGTLKDCDVVHWPEAGGKPNNGNSKMLSETLFKSMLSGERVPVNQKYLNQEYMNWRANIVAAGNSHIQYKNEQARTTAGWSAPYTVKLSTVDNDMPQRLAEGAWRDARALQHRTS